MSKMNITSRKTNIEIKSKLPCEKPLLEQLEVMEEYTKVHKRKEKLHVKVSCFQECLEN